MGLGAAGADLDRQPAHMPRAVVGQWGHGADVAVLWARPALVVQDVEEGFRPPGWPGWRPAPGRGVDVPGDNQRLRVGWPAACGQRWNSGLEVRSLVILAWR